MILSYDQWAAGFLLLVGLLAIFESSKLSLGGPSSPGPGFFPFYLSLTFSLVCLALMFRSSVAPKAEKKITATSEPLRRDNVAWTLLALVGYAFGLEPLGFLLATFLLMLCLSKVVESRKWVPAIGGSLTISVLAYALFRLIQVRLPAGIWLP